MEPMDIESIIKKYSSGYSVTNPKSYPENSNHNFHDIKTDYSYMKNNTSSIESPSFIGTDFSKINEFSYNHSKADFLGKEDTYHSNKEIEKPYNYRFNSNNEGETEKITNYQFGSTYGKPWESETSYHYQPYDFSTAMSKLNINKINEPETYDASSSHYNFTSNFSEYRPLSTNLHLNEQSKYQENKSEENIMNLFNNETKNHFNVFNEKSIKNEIYEQKPEISGNETSSIYNTNLLAESNFNNLKNTTEMATKPTSNWNQTSQYTTFNNQASLQLNQNQEHLLKSNKQHESLKEGERHYKKVESITTNYPPNNEGFIPLHKTKEQIQDDTYDLNDYEFRDKKVYDQLEITGKIKTSKLTEFEKSSFCGWKNNVIYDISTKDDNKNKYLFGKWC